MTLETASVLAEGGELGYREITGPGEKRIVDRGEMAGGEDEDILTLAVPGPGLRVTFHDSEKEGGEEVGAAHRPARMARLGLRDHPDYVTPYLRCDFLKFFNSWHKYGQAGFYDPLNAKITNLSARLWLLPENGRRKVT